MPPIVDILTYEKGISGIGVWGRGAAGQTGVETVTIRGYLRKKAKENTVSQPWL